MSEEIIGPRPCFACGGEYGTHVFGCAESPPAKPQIDPLERIANVLEAVLDKEKGALRMFDCERGKVYATHLGGKLCQLTNAAPDATSVSSK